MSFSQSKGSAVKTGTSAETLQEEQKQAEILSLKEIDTLIAETDYTTALIELSNYLHAYPDQLDFVQRRIDKIMKARQQYIVLADNLIDVMENEPENAQKKLEIIAALESVEKNPTEEQLQFIRQAKIAAQFTYYRAQFRKIMDESSAFTDGTEYTRAVSKIQEGFYMYRQEFYEENPESVTSPVTPAVNRINSSCRDYINIQDKLKNSFTAFLNAVNSGNYREAENAYNNFNIELQNFANIRNNIYNDALFLKNTFSSLQKKNRELTEASYLPFIFKFSLGLENNPKTGIIGTMDSQFKNYIETIKPAIYNAVAKITFDQINSKNVDTVTQQELPFTKLGTASNFAKLGLTVNSMYDKIKTDFRYETEFKGYVQLMKYPETLISALNESYEILNKYQGINRQLKVIAKPQNAVQALRAKNSYPSQMIDCARQYDECAENAGRLLNEKWFAGYIKENSAKKDENAKTDYEILNNYYFVLNKTLYDVCKNASQIQWKETASYFASASDEIYSYYQNEYSKASDLLNKHYPKEALDLFVKTDSELNSDIQIIEACQKTLEENPAEKSFFAAEQKTVRDNISKMNVLKSDSQKNAVSSNLAILNSQRALNEAELRYSQAFKAFQRADYAVARRNIELSSTKYKESFDWQESSVLREESDRKLLALGQQINDAENKLIVAEVRSLKNQAKNEYYNGNFEKAENLLIRAKSRWAVTNGEEEDIEIKNLLALVETALSMKTGRVIPPTAPLYPEMSQILSIAHQFFDKGSALIKNGEREEGTAVLMQSKKKLQEIQLVYPLNQEASLLSLKIDQLIDPDAFNEMFEQKVKSARENYKIASRQQTAYTDLLDLYEIRPDYPGLKNLIYQVEIEIGVRQKPVDNSSLVKSQDLTKEASRIVNNAGNSESQLRSALEKLDQAIQLNPNNDQAILLKDRVQVSLGGRASVVLSSSDEAKYQKAIQELQKNNIVGAYALVEQLLQKPENRRSSKVLDLQKKVKALL